MWIAFLAAVSMVFQDLFAVIQVQAESRNKAVLSGVMDSVGWLLAITTMTISVTALQGHSFKEKVAVIVLVSLANFGGSYLGVKIGKKYVKDQYER